MVKTKLFVKGLSPITTRNSFIDAFLPYGVILEAKVIPMKRLGIIIFENEVDTLAAYTSMQGQQLDGVPIHPEFERSKEDFYFPYLPVEMRSQLRFDDVALYSVSEQSSADITSEIILTMMGTQIAVVTDATACIGGNTISFAKHFYHVNAVEIDQTRFDYLTHNLKVCNIHNVNCYNNDYLDILPHLKQNIVFIDAPWGGPEYKNVVSVDICLSDIPLGEIIKRINQNTMTQLVVLKLPYNIRFSPILEYIDRESRVSGRGHLAVCKFPKMMLVVIDFLSFYEPFLERVKQLTGEGYKVSIFANGNWKDIDLTKTPDQKQQLPPSTPEKQNPQEVPLSQESTSPEEINTAVSQLNLH